jgi:hypothetical protein
MAYCICPGWLWWWRIWWNEDWQGKPKFSEKTCPSAALSTTNPTWPDPGANPGHRGGKPATNRLSYGAAFLPFNILTFFITSNSSQIGTSSADKSECQHQMCVFLCGYAGEGCPLSLLAFSYLVASDTTSVNCLTCRWIDFPLVNMPIEFWAQETLGRKKSSFPVIMPSFSAQRYSFIPLLELRSFSTIFILEMCKNIFRRFSFFVRGFRKSNDLNVNCVYLCMHPEKV